MSRQIIFVLVVVGILIILFNQPKKFLILNNQKIGVEIADTPAEQGRGLSGRASLPENTGMLFVYQDDVIPAFWMKEMNFNLDLIWLDKNWQIVGVEKNLSPATYPQTFSPNKPIRYVLEMTGGFVDKQQIKVGEKAYN